MATNSNFLVKVTNASMPDIKKALTAAGIEVRSILLVNKEEIPEPEGEGAESEEVQQA